MSVLVINRKESRFEAITFSTELHDILINLMQRGFGVRDLEQFVRVRYAYGKDNTENFAKYRFLMQNSKERIDKIASSMTNNLRAAYSIFPTSLHEYEQRRDYQNIAIINCEQLIKELQHVVEIFDVDINIYGASMRAIDREIGLIKKWRQGDNKIKSYVKG